jgi:hypothetical protein
MIGSKETKKHWKRIHVCLHELHREALDAVFKTFDTAPVRKDGTFSVLSCRAWIESQIETWSADLAANDASQMAITVVCNSVYGATGATAGGVAASGAFTRRYRK